MKILELNLTAFGAFTGTSLDFTQDAAGLHMVYGDNEAGKSTALRALRSMLFGIPVQSADNFQHAYAQLRIGARLMKRDGAQIAFVRRKGKTKTLRGPDDDEILDDHALTAFLGGVGQSLFEQMFAIGHEDLVTGGQEIISGGGNIGQALFAAGAGLIHLQALQQQMHEACEALFKPSGTKPLINSTLLSLSAARKEHKEALLSAKTWKTHHQALLSAQKDRETLQQRLDALKKQASRLARIRDGLPFISRKKEIDAALPVYDNVPDLPSDFSDNRRKAESDLQLARNDLKRAQAEIDGLLGQLNALKVPESLIQHAGAIEALQQDLGSHRKAQKDRPERLGTLRALQKQAADNLSEVSEEMKSHTGTGVKLPAAVVGDLQEMKDEHGRLSIRRETTVALQRDLSARRDGLISEKTALPAPVDVAPLKAALEQALSAGPIEKHLSELQSAAVSLEASLIRDLQRQTVWSGRMEEVDTLPCPSTETIDRFRLEMASASQTLEKLKSDRIAAEADITRTAGELTTIAQTVDVPLESDLSAARVVRGEGWGLIRQRLTGENPSPEAVATFTGRFDLPPPALPEAFEKSIAQADHIADRLRREAALVSRKADLEVQLSQLETRRAAIGNAIATATAVLETLSTRWHAEWRKAGITPLPPMEMRSWTADIQAIRAKLADLRAQRVKAQTVAAETAALRGKLAGALADSGKPAADDLSLALLIALARSRVEIAEKHAARREDVEKELKQVAVDQRAAIARQAEIDNALKSWQATWREKVATIGLAADISPSAAMTVIERIKTAKAQLAEADDFKKRIEGIDRDAADFKLRVATLAAALAPDLEEQPHERAAELLQSRLTTARDAQTTRKSLLERLNKVQADKAKADQRIAAAEALLGALCREAGCGRAEDLAGIENQSAEKRQHLETLKATADHIRRFSGGATIEAFISEADRVDIDGIEPKLSRIADEIASLDRSRSTLDETIGDLRNELKRMDGSARAAELAETAERLLGKLESDVEHYARLKTASVLLARTIERYREKYQGPLVSRASALFSQMTAGAFSGIRADYDDKGHPMLVGVRPESGELVAVAGMSDGSADQLYLALRLASLEQYLSLNEPLPFIVDDILLRFDDARAAATLQVLAALSEKTQVIFFTHHRHLVDLAKGRVSHPGLVFHAL
ncbi:MAG: AAA family ATPase [Pseudomonadota bacterium]